MQRLVGVVGARAFAIAALFVVMLAAASGCGDSRRRVSGDAGPGGVGVDSGMVARDAGVVPPGTDAGGPPPGFDAGGPPPMCTDFAGTYKIVGDCMVTFCSVSQDGCDVFATCDGPFSELTGTVSGSTAMFSSPAGLCSITRSGGSILGMCVGGAFMCSFEGFAASP